MSKKSHKLKDFLPKLNNYFLNSRIRQIHLLVMFKNRWKNKPGVSAYAFLHFAQKLLFETIACLFFDIPRSLHRIHGFRTAPGPWVPLGFRGSLPVTMWTLYRPLITMWWTPLHFRMFFQVPAKWKRPKSGAFPQWVYNGSTRSSLEGWQGHSAWKTRAFKTLKWRTPSGSTTRWFLAWSALGNIQ